jgi:hypothetical protein
VLLREGVKRQPKTLTTESTELHRGTTELVDVGSCAYCGGSCTLSKRTSKIKVELGGMVPSGVPPSP